MKDNWDPITTSFCSRHQLGRHYYLHLIHPNKQNEHDEKEDNDDDDFDTVWNFGANESEDDDDKLEEHEEGNPNHIKLELDSNPMERAL